jgi:2-oxoisovalerate dehydrogenase E2 component (dihydrolipoyl transacylase)
METKPPSGKVLSTPAVRAFAKENNVDISQVTGTGHNGRVTRDDVLSFMKAGSPVQAEVTSSDSTPSFGAGFVGIPSQPPITGVTEEDQVKKITGIKKAMTKTMTQALSIPTFTFSDDIDATEMMKMRKELKKQIPDLTLLPFFIKALSLAMTHYPEVNSIVNPALDGEGYIKEYVIKKDHNFSVAIDSDHGLVTPNIKKVNEKSILQINKDLRALVEKVKTNTVTQADYDNGTFSVSSVGNIGGRYFVPTILRPQVGIIAIGKA